MADCFAGPEVRVGYVRAAAPWILDAPDAGLRAVHGRKIAWQHYATSAEAALALDAGKIDAALMSSSAIAASLARGVPIRLVWIATVVRGRFPLFLSPGVAAREASVAALAGKRIGVEFLSPEHEALLVALSARQLTPSDVTLVHVSPGEVESIWLGRRVDALCLGPAWARRSLGAGARRVSLETDGHSPFFALAVRQDVLAGDRPAVASLVAALAARAAPPRPERSSRGLLSLRSNWARQMPPMVEQAGSGFLGGGPDGALVLHLERVARLVTATSGTGGIPRMPAEALAPEVLRAAAAIGIER